MCVKIRTLLCLVRIFILCSFNSVYNSALYMKCVRECADASMCGVINSIKHLEDYSMKGEVARRTAYII